jgi:hypothetical protein
MRPWIDRKKAAPRQQMLKTHPYDAAGKAYTLGPTLELVLPLIEHCENFREGRLAL